MGVKNNDRLLISPQLELDQSLIPVTIYATGSCNYETRFGIFFSVLQSGKHWRLLKGDLQDTTANRCIITGITEAVGCLKEPCRVTVVTATDLGMSRPEGKNRINGDLLDSLKRLIRKNRHEIVIDVWQGGGDRLRSEIVFISGCRELFHALG